MVEVRLRRANGELFRRRSVSVRTKTLARDRRDEFFEEYNLLEGGQAYESRLIVITEPEPPKMTTASWLGECKEKHWPRRVPSTANDYAQSSRDHIEPVLGTVPLEELSGRHIAQWLDDLSAKEVIQRGKAGKERSRIRLSVSSLKAAKTALSSALSIAVELGALERNPCIGMKFKWNSISKQRRREAGWVATDEDIPEKRLLTLGEVERLLTAAKESPIYPTLLLQAKCGLRIAEALAVRRSDFDLERNVLRIRRQLKRIELQEGKSRLGLEDLKTRSSLRDIPLPLSVREYVEALPVGDQPLTTNDFGRWLEPRRAQALIREAFGAAKLMDNAGKPDPTSHNLRFFWTSHLLNDLGTPVTVVSRLAGHSQVSTTLGYYSEATDKNLADAMKRIA